MRTAAQDATSSWGDWDDYYTDKRIGHQFMQVQLLRRLGVRKVLEIGPGLGLVTAMLDNAGFDVTTLDASPKGFSRPACPHIECDLFDLEPRRISGFDAILCCETLEHLPWNDVPGILEGLRASGARYLVVSVPYEGLQWGVSLHWTPYACKKRTMFKLFNRWRSFPREEFPSGHQWEVGFRGYPLNRWERVLRSSGWSISTREFTWPCRSVFHVLKARAETFPGSRTAGASPRPAVVSGQA